MFRSTGNVAGGEGAVMVRADRRTLGALSVLAIVGTLALTACGSEADAGAKISGDYPDLTIAQTKSPVQLLRNDAASRLPPSTIESVEETLDGTVACLEEEDDPTGIVRSWHSTALVTVQDGSIWRVDDIVDNLIESYTEQDWLARSLGESADTRSSLLTSKKSTAEITVTGKRPDKDQVATSTEEVVDEVTIEIQVHGPCVRTAGADSDEIAKLESP